MSGSRSKSRPKPVVLITVGDYNGIGPEVALKAVRSRAVRDVCNPVLIGSAKAFRFYADQLSGPINFTACSDLRHFPTSRGIHLLDIGGDGIRIRPGHVSKDAGAHAGSAVEIAARHCLCGDAEAVVTSPTSKEAMNLAGYKVPGQTELLASLSYARDVAMMLCAGSFRVGLATIHLPLCDVADTLTQALLIRRIETLRLSLMQDFAIPRPRIAVLGLNPHAGERGLIGNEEQTLITPVIRRLARKGRTLNGPFPADGFFATKAHQHYDLVLAMYHDQGLIPLKMEGFNIGVNFSAGLPIVRTSPDHGTAFDIAGNNIADPSSMIEAIKLAAFISRNRRKHNHD